jgi:DNA-binding Lrp family transcriptional regulator
MSYIKLYKFKEKRVSMRKKILEAIDKNSKLTTQDLAIILDEKEEEVISTIKSMEAEGIICGYPTLINWDKTDKDKVTALIEIKVAPQRGQGFERIAERIYKFDEVKSVYLMSGGYDLTIMIDGKNMKEISNFVWNKLAPLESVESTATYFVLKKYKEHGLPLVNSKIQDERMLITP